MTDYDPTSLHQPSGGTVAPAASVASPDLDRYSPYVAHFDLPEERRAELLLAIWRMMQSFVDRAFGDDPVQQRLGLGDKGHGKDESAALPVIDLGKDESGTTLSDSFHQHVIGDTRQERDS